MSIETISNIDKTLFWQSVINRQQGTSFIIRSISNLPSVWPSWKKLVKKFLRNTCSDNKSLSVIDINKSIDPKILPQYENEMCLFLESLSNDKKNYIEFESYYLSGRVPENVDELTFYKDKLSLLNPSKQYEFIARLYQCQRDLYDPLLLWHANTTQNCDALNIVAHWYWSLAEYENRSNLVTVDDNKAFELWKYCADHGHVGGLYNLGMCYEFGYGPPKINNLLKNIILSLAKTPSNSIWTLQ